MTPSSVFNRVPALSVKQPWVELILNGRKTIEVRSWRRDYRGRIWLHASKRPNTGASAHFKMTGLFTGGYVGFATLLDIVEFDSRPWKELSSGHCVPWAYSKPSFGWVFKDPVRFSEPVSGSGSLGLFRPEPQIERALCAALRTNDEATSEGRQWG